MTPGVEEAWIAVVGVGVGGVIGVSGSWLGARINARSARATTSAQIEANSKDVKAQIEASEATTKAQIEASEATTKAQIDSALTTVHEQIEADRQNRIWEKRAAAYVEAVKLLRHQQEIRYSQVQHLITGKEFRTDPASVDRQVLEAELIAYGSSDVLDALAAATTAGDKFLSDFWTVERMEAGSTRGDLVQQARAEAPDATDLEEKVLDIIRAELQARAGDQPGAPIPRSRLGI